MILLKDFAQTVKRVDHNSIMASIWSSSVFEMILTSFLIASSFATFFGDFLISFVISCVCLRALIISLFLMASLAAKWREYV